MRLQTIQHHKKEYLPLLLQADEEESQIDTYLERGTLYVALEEERVIGVAVVTEERDGVELKNMAIDQAYRQQGYGKRMLEQLFDYYKGKTMFVGTGDSGLTVPFYEACGFTYSYTLEHFFTEHYAEPIIENGVLLEHMIVLKKAIPA